VQYSVQKEFIATPIDVLCSNFVKFGRWEIGKVMRYLPDKKFDSLSSSRFCTDRAQNLLEPASDNVLRVLQISSKSVHFRRSYIRTCVKIVRARSKVNQIFGWSLASSRIIKASNTSSCLTVIQPIR